MLAIDVVPSSHLSPDCSYELLGHHTLVASKAKNVLCIGGGDCIVKEEASAVHIGVAFTVFDFIRFRPDGEQQRHLRFDGQPVQSSV